MGFYMVEYKYTRWHRRKGCILKVREHQNTKMYLNANARQKMWNFDEPSRSWVWKKEVSHCSLFEIMDDSLFNHAKNDIFSSIVRKDKCFSNRMQEMNGKGIWEWALYYYPHRLPKSRRVAYLQLFDYSAIHLYQRGRWNWRRARWVGRVTFIVKRSF